ncbi:MAG: transglycosylase [Bacteroidales bacterium 45-6]|nr:MAG: transglycosylase [Bacteroidales bacterium 45-6]
MSQQAIIHFLKKILSPIKSFFKAGKNYYRKSPWYSKVIQVIAGFFIVFFLYLFLVDVNFLWLFGKSPGLSSINNPNQSIATTIVSADGKTIGKYFRENRTPVEFDEISPMLVNALIYTEDERFYEHFGIDIKGVFAAMKDALHGKARGASTISQQLVKNMFKTRNQYSRGLLGYVPGVNLLIMKTKEWITAVKIEMFYSKHDILKMYLNTVDFGSNAYGIKTAAKTFFGTTPMKLTTEESATLVGLLKAPTSYSPLLNPEKSLKRRNIVLRNLQTHKVISKQTCDSLEQIPMKLHYKMEQAYDGQALYFREYLASELSEWCKTNGYDLYSDGLKIYVTIDSRMQQYAEEAVRSQMKLLQKRFDDHWRGQNPWQDENHKEIPLFAERLAQQTHTYKLISTKYKGNKDSIDYYLNKPHLVELFDYEHENGRVKKMMSTMDSIRYMNRFMHTGFVAMEPQTGYVKAWVGDVDFNFWKYDKVAQSKRQPGSTFKLFVYTAAMMHGMSPCDTRVDQPVSWENTGKDGKETWSPTNANGYFLYRPITLKNAFAQSINSIAVQVGKEVGISEVIKYAHLLGIKSPLKNEPALTLGASDVSLLEMVNSYSTVVNEGQYHDPIVVTRIEDRNGNVLYENKLEQKRVIPYEDAWLMLELLKRGLTEPGGTSRALWSCNLFKWNTDFGGKTGTSNNHSDAWYVGVTPNLVGGAWVGGEQRSVHFRTGNLGQGSRTALPIFASFMEKVLADESLKRYRGKFPTKPKEEIKRDYNCPTYIPADTLDVATDSIDAPDVEPEVVDPTAAPVPDQTY